MWLVYSIYSYPREGNDEPIMRMTLDNFETAQAFVEMQIRRPGTWREHTVTPLKRVVVYTFTTPHDYTTWYVEKV